MLRSQLGDDAFFRGIKNYYSSHKHSTASSEDLRAALEKASGKDLRTFFARWVYDSGHPQYELAYYWLGQRELRIVLSQRQPGNVFTDPVPVTISTASGKRDIVLKPTGKLFIERVPLRQKPTGVEVDPHNVLLDETTIKGN
jgi:aminopeptidase N